MTQEQNRRIIEAINETVRHLSREKAYLPHLQNQARIVECEAHLVKLWRMVVA